MSSTERKRNSTARSERILSLARWKTPCADRGIKAKRGEGGHVKGEAFLVEGEGSSTEDQFIYFSGGSPNGGKRFFKGGEIGGDSFRVGRGFSRERGKITRKAGV